MYQIWTAIADGQFVGVTDKDGHIPDVEGIISAAKENDAKLIYLCNPNNPTGYLFPRYDIVQILEETNAPVSYTHLDVYKRQTLRKTEK